MQVGLKNALDGEIVIMRAEAVEGLAVQHFTVIGMGDADHQLRPFL